MNELNINGQITKDSETIDKHVAKYYEEIFTAINPSRSIQDFDIPEIRNLLTDEQKRAMDISITCNETKTSINKLCDQSAPGQDACSSKLLKWLFTLTSTLINTVHNQLHSEGSTKAFFRLLRLLKKPDKPSYNMLKAWRPISLCNSIFKSLDCVMMHRVTSCTQTTSSSSRHDKLCIQSKSQHTRHSSHTNRYDRLC